MQRILGEAVLYVREKVFPAWEDLENWTFIYDPESKKEFIAQRDEFIQNQEQLREILTWTPNSESEKELEFIKNYDPLAWCCNEEKKIVFYEITFPENPIWIQEVIVHEICHIGASGHGPNWVKNMNNAAEKASNAGLDELAEQIELDIYEMSESD